MFEKDFIMREVQKMVQVLQVIMGLKQEKKFAQAMDEIDNTYDRFFDENAHLMQAKDIEGLKQLCTKNGRFAPDLAFALAEIINEEAEILEIKEDESKAKQKFKLSLGLYQAAVAEKDAAVPIDIAAKIQRLETKLGRK